MFAICLQFHVLFSLDSGLLFLLLPDVFPGLHVVVEAAETVLVESISHRLVIALSVFL